MKGTIEAGTFSLTITCSQSFCCFVYNFVCIRGDGLHALRVMATLGVGGNCAFLVETTSTNTLFIVYMFGNTHVAADRQAKIE